MIDLKPFADTLNQKPVAIFGLGASGLATTEALINAGIDVIAWDDSKAAQDAANACGATTKPLTQDILNGCANLILSPGVPLTHPEPHAVVNAANAANCEIIGDVEVLHRANHDHTTIGITGTNGKSTTTALLTHVLNACGKEALMGGNIGVPALTLAPKSKDAIFVLEMSSYQIDLCPTFHPDIGVLLNITPDHIDRHGTFENYAAIKHRMVDNANTAIYAEKLDQSPLNDHTFPMLAGAHNAQNIIAVLAVCEELGIDQEDAIKAVKTFPGLAHRQYLARTVNNIHFINDSKATNAEATAKALGCMENIHWIVGGQAKDGGLNGLEQYKSRITHAYLIGECATEFEGWMKENDVPYTLSKTMDNAVSQAYKTAQSSDEEATILLSPACASWDQFKSFEHRGDTFINLVEGLE